MQRFMRVLLLTTMLFASVGDGLVVLCLSPGDHLAFELLGQVCSSHEVDMADIRNVTQQAGSQHCEDSLFDISEFNLDRQKFSIQLDSSQEYFVSFEPHDISVVGSETSEIASHADLTKSVLPSSLNVVLLI